MSNPPFCPKCPGTLRPGVAMRSTLVPGIPDFIGDRSDTRIQTMNVGGPGELINCLKCDRCGHSEELKNEP